MEFNITRFIFISFTAKSKDAVDKFKKTSAAELASLKRKRHQVVEV